jgi:hypothetical protein
VSKGVSETFDEHEQDTARRSYSKEIVDSARRTATMPAVNLQNVRRESGTQAAVTGREVEATEAAIDRHVRERMEQALGPNPVESRLGPPTPYPPTTAPPTISLSAAPPSVEDPHARPTMQAVVMAVPIDHVLAPASFGVATPNVDDPATNASRPTPAPLAVASSTSSPELRTAEVSSVEAAPSKRELSIPRWVLTLAMVGVLALVAAAVATGFFWGWLARDSHHL